MKPRIYTTDNFGFMNKRAAGQSKPDLPSENFVGNAEREAENAQSVDKTEEK